MINKSGYVDTPLCVAGSKTIIHGDWRSGIIILRDMIWQEDEYVCVRTSHWILLVCIFMHLFIYYLFMLCMVYILSVSLFMAASKGWNFFMTRNLICHSDAVTFFIISKVKLVIYWHNTVGMLCAFTNQWAEDRNFEDRWFYQSLGCFYWYSAIAHADSSVDCRCSQSLTEKGMFV